jgi:hypothetical protein
MPNDPLTNPTPAPETPPPAPAAEPSLLSGKPPEEKPPEAVQTPEEKAKAEAEAATKAADDTKATPFKVDEIKLAEGFEVDPTLAGELTEVINEFGIPRSAVTKLLSLQEKAMSATSEAGSRLWSETQDTWRKEITADPDIGGDKWGKVSASIGQVLDKYGSPEVRAALDMTGAGNNPHIARMMAKIAADLTEPGFVPSGKPANQPQDTASKLYPDMK